MATLCFGKDKINGNAGHDADDVLVLAFTGSAEETVPGADRADWAAKSAEDFIAFPAFDQLGDSLIAKISGGSGGGSNATEPETESDSGSEGPVPTTLVKSVKPATATGGVASSSTETSASTSNSCSWEGHCDGDACSSDDDCSGELVCTSSKCASG